MAKKTKTTASVEDKLKALHQLQVIDTEVDKIRIIRGELPLEIQDLEDLITGLNTRLEKFNEELQLINDDIAANKILLLWLQMQLKIRKQLKKLR